MYTEIPMNPGVFLDDTPAKAEGFYTNADKIRFVRGIPQVMGGWEAVTSDMVSGKCRGIHAWADVDTLKWAAFGTHTHLYALNDSDVYDITPVVERGQLTNPFSTTNGSAIVSVADASHGLAVGGGVSFSGAAAVGGITVSGAYTVTSVTSANAYTITASSQASSTAGPGGGTVSYKYYLPIGLADGVGGAGYGTGTYSTGTYSSTNTSAYYLRTWTISNFGGNLVACPRGGGIYEWAPATSASELVTNGSFTGSATGWTLGTNWAYGANNAAATLSDAALSQSITLEPMAYYILECDITQAAGSVQISLGGTNVGASVGASANIQRTVYGGNAGGTATLAFTGTGFTGTVDNVTVKQLMTAEAMTNAPTQNTCVLVTPDGFIMAFGTVELSTGNFNPMHIRWSDIAPNSHDWTPTDTNLSRFYTLGVGSRIIAACVTTNEILIWTDRALYAGVYVNNSTVVYSFRLVAESCGLIGANAAAVHGGVAYWWSPDGTFYRYGGGTAEPMQSTVQQDAFNNIANVQEDKIFAAAVGAFRDVIWLYPDGRDGNEVSRYVLLCTQEPAPLTGGAPISVGSWAPGTFTRTAWLDSDVFPSPIAIDADGHIYYQERGNTADGGNISWSLRTGAFKTGEGETLWKMLGFIPDFKVLAGGCTLTVYSYLWPQSTPVTHGPFSITSGTEMVDLLSDAPVGRYQALELSGNSSPAAMRSGLLMMDLDDTEMEF